MASTTPNLNLKLLGTSLTDKETQFEEWRTDINGEGDGSNMSKIDAAYGRMSDAIGTIQSSDVTNVMYDAGSKKLTKTINGTTTDIVGVDDLAGAMDVITNEQIDALFDE